MYLSYAETKRLATSLGVVKLMLDYIKFENITKKSSNAASPTLPLITISKQAIYFNVVFRRLHPNLKAVAIYYYNDQLLLSFYTDFSEENSIRLSRTDKSYSCAFMKQAEILKNRTTAIDLDHTNFKYVVDMKPNCYQIVVDLNNPYITRERETYYKGWC
ncbi:hypothetical protein [Lactiplantibacillus paraxiangfangensis]|uniref:hypothetical protein n=2 Tax=Lactiplantibacillus paraxiangfangensis TaxID=3076224 RepID=UPI0030C65FDD